MASAIILIIPPSGQHDNDLIIFKLRESKPQKAKPSKRPKAMEPSTPLAVETTTTTKNQREREREKKSALPTLSLTTATNLESAKRGR
jgi:hypothetical protein